MRLLPLLLTAALVPMAAPAQDTPPATGLSDLNAAVSELDDNPEDTSQEPAAAPAGQPPATGAPADPPETEPAEPPAAEPAAQPERPRLTPPAGPLTGAQRAELAAAGQRGQLLIALARAGIIGTQDMLSRVSDPEGAGIAGWIATPEGNGMRIIFYARGESGPVAVYRADILGTRVTSRDVFLGADRPALNPLEARMAAARDATDGLENQACGGQPFNVFVIPPASASAPVDVYQISPATQRDRFPLGGHFRSTVAADGTVGDTRSFAEGCTDLAAPAAPAGQARQPLDVAAPDDALPTEIHAFLSLWSGRPLRVAAGDPPREFLVAGEAITAANPPVGR
ncbi:hypothetical protein RCO27_19140 [Sphingosinicella sp. LHD-64]|uniref:hypothetical protein n=1 Tax=Sphingosinicella sp. LHD-64 TaxID=3072139 RepID=UPI00280E5FCF|nr:hypothetical protein [Sphingosinicella sp. LHD-64]MDQ8758350.1 hypothetical protein [Sphingosinicella sp. LHD-64]